MNRRRLRGSAGLEHWLTVTVLALVGLVGMAALGGDLRRAIIDDAHVAHGEPVTSAQAGLLSGSLETAERAGIEAREIITAKAYITHRPLFGIVGDRGPTSSYERALGQGFMRTLRSLGPDNHWIDMGSGEGHAVGDFLRIVHDRDRTKAPRVTAVAYEEGITGYLSALFPRFRSLYGRYVEDIPAEELGHATLISDLYGPLSYAPQFDRVLQHYGNLLVPGGEIHAILGRTTAQRAGRGGRHTFTTAGRTEAFLEEFNQRVGGLKAEVSLADPGTPSDSPLRLHFTKTDDTVHVPELQLTNLRRGNPPQRQYLFK